jgi:hypothetical protein
MNVSCNKHTVVDSNLIVLGLLFVFVLVTDSQRKHLICLCLICYSSMAGHVVGISADLLCNKFYCIHAQYMMGISNL